MTATAFTSRPSREITLAYLGDLLRNAGFIDDRQKNEIAVASESDVMSVINEQYGFRASVTKAERDLTKGAIDLSNLEQYVKLKSGAEIESSDQHIVNAVDYLLQHAYDSRASDIHIEPKREHAQIRFRIDGVLHAIQPVPALG